MQYPSGRKDRMRTYPVEINGRRIFPSQDLFLIAGPCVMESGDVMLEIAAGVKAICDRLGISYLFKSSFDKANRSSVQSFRGPGLSKGLALLAEVKRTIGVPVVTDVHEPAQAAPVAEVADVLQVPAFLCRQTDLLVAAGRTGKCVNVKKGQFMAPWDMENVVAKVRSTGNDRVMITDRGTSFGYNNLVSDMRSIAVMRRFGCPVVLDGTHSVQLPGGLGDASGGERDMVPVLVRAAVAAGVDGLFLEVHPDPDRAACDGPTMLALDELEPLLTRAAAIRRAAGFAE